MSAGLILNARNRSEPAAQLARIGQRIADAAAACLFDWADWASVGSYIPGRRGRSSIEESRIRTDRDALTMMFGERPKARIVLEASTESEWEIGCCASTCEIAKRWCRRVYA